MDKEYNEDKGYKEYCEKMDTMLKKLFDTEGDVLISNEEREIICDHFINLWDYYEAEADEDEVEYCGAGEIDKINSNSGGEVK